MLKSSDVYDLKSEILKNLLLVLYGLIIKNHLAHVACDIYGIVS